MLGMGVFILHVRTSVSMGHGDVGAAAPVADAAQSEKAQVQWCGGLLREVSLREMAGAASSMSAAPIG